MNRVKDKVAIVTGGGVGIGRATAELLAQEGAKVVLTQRHAEQGQEVAQQIEKQGGIAKFVQQDVTSEEDWQKVIQETQASFGTPDILVNNAGIYRIENIPDIVAEGWHKIMDVNAWGVFLGMKYCAPLMVDKGGGSIVNMSSVAGLIGFPGHAAYGASKGAVLTMTKDAAMEFAPCKVRVNSIHPAYIDTEMADYGAEQRGASKEDLGKMHPIGHIGEPMDVAYGVVYLASDESKFVTGAELVIDGGMTAQ
ncbi:MAG: glucose 1-dehydrogenase [Spirulinaceae cyanobacterium]